MPDNDGTIRVGTQVDTSGLKAGSSESKAITNELLADLKAQYAQATAAVKQATANMAEATAYMGQSARAGVTEAVAALKTYEQELLTAQLAQSQVKASMDLAVTAAQAESASLNESAAAAGKDAAASLEDAVASDQLAYSKQRASLAARALTQEIGGPMSFVIGRVAGESAALGTILEAAFPAVAAVALGEVLFEVAGKVEALYDRFVLLKEIEEEVAAIGERLAKDTQRVWDEVDKSIEKRLRDEGKYVQAAQHALTAVSAKPIDLSNILKTEEIEKKLKDLPHQVQEDLKKAFGGGVEPYQLGEKLEFINQKLKAIDEESQKVKQSFQSPPVALGGSPAASLGAASPQTENVATKMLDAQRAIYNGLRIDLEARQKEYAQQIITGNADVVKAHAEEVTKAQEAARKAQAAERAIEEGIRKADEEALADLKASHQLTTQEEITFWQERLADESQYSDRVREIKRALGRDYQEIDRQAYAQREKDAREGATRLLEIINEEANAAQETGGKAGELSYLQDEAQKLAESLVGGAQEAVAAYDRVMKQIPVVTREAAAEAQRNLKTSVDEMYETWVGSGKRTIEEITAFWQGVQRTYSKNEALVKESIKRIAEEQQKAIEQAQKLANLRIKGQEETQVGGLEQQRAVVERGAALNPASQTTAGRVAEMEAMRQIDKQESDARIAAEDQTLKQLVEFYKQNSSEYQAELSKMATAATSGDLVAVDAAQKRLNEMVAIYKRDTAAYQAELNKRNQLTQQADLKQYQDTTRIIQAQQQEWNSFFNTFNNGFTQAINKALTGQQSFGKSMQQLYNQLVEQAITYEAKKYLLELEGFLKKKILGTQVAAAMTASNVAQAQSYAGLAATTEFTFALADSAGDLPYATAMAGAALGIAESYASLAAFEQGTSYVPNTGIALVHQGERISSAADNKKITEALSGGGSSTRGDTNYTLHYSPQYHGSTPPPNQQADAAHMLRLTRQATLGLHT
jgi:hypothetical protein